MAWVNVHAWVWRVAILALLATAILGPWVYNSDGAPPAEWCRAPFRLLEDGQCVAALSGTEVMTFWAPVMMDVVPRSLRLVMGQESLAAWAREVLFLLLFGLLVLPFLSTLALLLGGHRRRRGWLSVVVWGAAVTLGLLVALVGSGRAHAELWGIWLYTGVVLSAVVLEWIEQLAARQRG